MDVAVPLAAGVQSHAFFAPRPPLAAPPALGGPGPLLAAGAGAYDQDGERLRDLDGQIGSAVGDPDTFSDLDKVLQLQDWLYERFKAKYASKIPLDDALTVERVQLLQAISTGDVRTIRAFIAQGRKFNWNFVFPPAQVSYGADRSIKRNREGWCRSPLCLLVRPQEGAHLDNFMRDVSDADRYALIKEVLALGKDTADPNFPAAYWCSPAVHACLEGDVEVLRLLYRYGCDLEQRVEFSFQPVAAWGLAHAAAMCGHVEILNYLKEHVSIAVFTEPDGDGSNPLHTLMGSSKDEEAARFLLDVGCDAFAVNRARRSPLSMAIEELPEIAEDMLALKAQKHHKWWSQHLFRFSFDGVVLPESANGGPLRVLDRHGSERSILELIVMHKRLGLVMMPLVRDLVDLKWSLFGRRLCFLRLANLAALTFSSYLASVTNIHHGAFVASSVVFLLASFLELSRNVHKLSVHIIYGTGYIGPWTFFDLGCLSLANVAWFVRFQALEGMLIVPVSATIMSLIQVFLLLRFLHISAVFKFIGQMLISLFLMVEDVAKFTLIIIMVILGFANGFASLVHFSLSQEEIDTVDFDLSYGGLVSQLLLGLMGGGDLHNIIDAVPVDLYYGAQVLYWSFNILGFLCLMNLLIAVLNTSYTKVDEKSESEWVYRRLYTLLDLEVSASKASIQEYFHKLHTFNNKRTTMQFC